MTENTNDNKRVKRNRSNTNSSAAQWIVHTLNGERMPDGVFEKIDKAVQRAMDESRVRLAATTVRV